MNKKSIFKLTILSLVVIYCLTATFTVFAKTINVDAGQEVGEIQPSWGTMISWDLSDFSDQRTENLPDGWFKALYPWTNKVILMTCSGGRPSCEMYHEDSSGNPYYNFNPLSEAVKNILRSGKDRNGNFLIKPVIVLAQVPYELAANASPPTYNYFNVNNDDRPKDYDKYYNYIQALAQAMVNNFGLEEVQTWSWKLFTEPDNSIGWWDPHGNPISNRNEYFKLYDYTAAALESVIPSSKLVFGPGNMLNENTWGKDIIAHAATGTNYKTGQTGTRMNTFTFSWYARHGAGYKDLQNYSEDLQTRITAFKNNLEDYPQLKASLLGSDETTIYDDENGNVYLRGDGSEVGASWAAGLYKRSQDNHISRMAKWWFWTTGGLSSVAGNKSTTYNFGIMTDKMKEGKRLLLTDSGSQTNTSNEVDAVAAYDEKNDIIRVLVYNHNPSRTTKVDETVDIVLNNINAVNGSSYIVRHWRIDQNHSNFYTLWSKEKDLKGIPTNSGIAQSEFDIYQSVPIEGWDFYTKRIAYYDKYDDLQKLEADRTNMISGNTISTSVTLPGHSVSLLEFVGVKPINNVITFTDTIDSRSEMVEYSTGLKLVSDISQVLGDTSRLKRTNTNANPAEYIIYQRSNMQNFEVTTYHNSTTAPVFTFYKSDNGSNWTQITSGITTSDIVLSNGWTKRIYTQTGLPANVNYLKIEWPTGGTDSITPQLGNVNIDYQLPIKPISAPTGLQASTTSGQINLSWNPVNGAECYTLKKALTPGGSYEIVASGIIDTSYTLNNAYGTQYYYVVTSVAGSQESEISNEVGPVSVSIFKDNDFLSVTNNWSVDQGNWNSINGEYKQMLADGGMNRATIKNVNNFQNFVVEMDVKIDTQPNGSNSWVGLIFRKAALNDDWLTSGYLLTLGPDGIVGMNRQSTNLLTASTLARPASEYVKLKVVTIGSVMDIYVNNEKVGSIQDSVWGSGYISLISYNNTATFDNVNVTNLADTLTEFTAVGEQNKVVLNWNVNAKAVTYTVERKLQNSNNTFTVIGSDLTTSKYEDYTAVSGVGYIYRVKAIDANGNVIEASKEEEASSYAYNNYFVSGSTGLIPNTGSWNTINGVYQQTSMTVEPPMATFSEQTFDDFCVELDVKINNTASPNNWAGIAFRKSNSSDSPWNSGYLFNISQDGNVGFTKQGMSIGNVVNSGINPTAGFVKLKVVANGNTLRGYVNGKLLLTVTDSTWNMGYTSLVTFNNSCSFDNIKIVDSVPGVPLNVQASSAPGSKKIDLTWNSADNANYYQIKRSTSLNGSYEIIGTAKGLSFTDNFALKNQSYYYIVTALNNKGVEGDVSAIVGPINAGY